MRVPYSKAVAGGSLVLAVLALGVAATSEALRAAAFAVAFAALFVGATAVSRANAIADILEGYAGRRLCAAAWGIRLPPDGDELPTRQRLRVAGHPRRKRLNYSGSSGSSRFVERYMSPATPS
jgi:hypothetical protein